MLSPTKRRAAASALAGMAGATVVGLLAYTLPMLPRNEVWEAAAWGILLLMAFAGWGSLVHAVTLPHRRADIGLRMLWGASVLAWLGGSLAAFSLFSRGAAMLLVQAGTIAAGAFAVLRREALLREVRLRWRLARPHWALALLGVGLAACVLFFYLGAISDPVRNPYDDDVAYIPLAQKLLQTGTLVEPFSTRRLTAYGGQTLFQAFMLIRTRFDQTNAFDHGVAMVLFTALVAYHPGRGMASTLLKVLVIALVPSLSRAIPINNASYFSGLAFFFGLYRTLMWLPASGERLRRVIPIPALVGAAACILRQSFIVAVVLVFLASYTLQILGSREPWRRRFREPLLTAGATLIALLPWWILAWRSNHTFLYPAMLGFANPALSFDEPSMTGWDRVRYVVECMLENAPIHTLPLLILVCPFLPDVSPRRPLRALWIASIGAFIALAVQVQSDAFTLSRYSFGFLAALAVAVVLSAGPSVRVPTAVLALVAGCIAWEFVAVRSSLAKLSERYLEAIGERVRRNPQTLRSLPPEHSLYRRAQATIPQHQRAAILLDEPFYLDFSRNDLLNLDLPGFASPPPGLPQFRGADPVATYFLSQSIRYLIVTREEYSRFHYNRELWSQHTLREPYWRRAGPYVIDFLDTAAELKRTHRVLFDERGIVVIDLAQGAEP